jgi:putative endopeptidase
MTHRSYTRAARFAAVLLACSAFQVAPAAAQQQSAGAAAAEPKVVHFGSWGVDISTRDTSVKPGDDFQRYASGKWMDANDIPPDKRLRIW